MPASEGLAVDELKLLLENRSWYFARRLDLATGWRVQISRLSSMEIIFNKVCVLVTAAFVLTLVPGFRRSERSLASLGDKATK